MWKHILISCCIHIVIITFQEHNIWVYLQNYELNIDIHTIYLHISCLTHNKKWVKANLLLHGFFFGLYLIFILHWLRLKIQLWKLRIWSRFASAWCPMRTLQISVLQCKSTTTLIPTRYVLTIIKGFKMRYCVKFYLQGNYNYQKSE